MSSQRSPQPADSARLTSRAAVLAVVICAVALSLAYPVREYIAQRRQIAQLQAERQATLTQVRKLQHEQRRLKDPAFVEQLAMDRLHLCMPGATCYVVTGTGDGGGQGGSAGTRGTPWYERVWSSVKTADQGGGP